MKCINCKFSEGRWNGFRAVLFCTHIDVCVEAIEPCSRFVREFGTEV